jgi:hypothetical protein
MLLSRGARHIPVQASEFHSHILPHIFDRRGMDADWSAADSHRLAIICMVLANGTFYDLEDADYLVHSAYWNDLGKSALSLHSVMEYPSLQAIQALVGLFSS